MSKYERLKYVAEYIDVPRRRGFDNVIAVSGQEQIGKSSLSLVMGRKLNGGKPLDLEKAIGYNIDEVIEEVPKLPPESIYILDEASRSLWRRNWASADNKKLILLFRQIGMNRLTFFLNTPVFREIENPIRNNRVQFWIHVYHKEVDIHSEDKKPLKFYAVLFEKNQHIACPDPWGIDGLATRKARKIIPLIDTTTRVKDKLGYYAKIPSYVDHFTFPPLPDDYWKRYLALSKARKFERKPDEGENSGTRLQNTQQCLKLTLKHLKEQGLTGEKISEIMGGKMTPQHICRIIKNV